MIISANETAIIVYGRLGEETMIYVYNIYAGRDREIQELCSRQDYR